MSSSAYQDAYKTRNGAFASVSMSHRDRTKMERKQQRTNVRQEAHSAHRHVEPTPQKKQPLNKVTSGAQKSNDVAVPTTSKGPVSNTLQSNTSSQLSRQEAFRLKFKQYRKEKEEKLQMKKAPPPFVSAVTSGRFIDLNEGRARLVARSVAPKPLAGKKPEKDTKFSPINTRSRKRQLLSPSKLPTPTRKSRKISVNANPQIASKLKGVVRSINRLAPKTRPQPEIEAAAKTAPRTGIRPKVVPRLAGKPVATNIKKIPSTGISNLRTKPTSVPTAANRVLKKAPCATITSAQATNKKTLFEVPVLPQKKNKPVSALVFNNSPKIPSEFKFNAPGGLMTSTIVKKRKSIARVDTNVDPDARATALFNESISPIESATEATAPAAPAIAAELPEDLNITPVSTKPDMNTSANYVSPFVTIGRGSRRSKGQEQEARDTKYALNSRRSVLNNSIEKRQNREAAIYFRAQMKRETDRLLETVNKWDAYKAEHLSIIPSEYVDVIDVAIGQTRLLTANKFQQFRVLIEQCEECITVQPVRPEDLEGFWGMMFMQVENCDKRFARLETLMLNGWEDPDLKKKVIKTKPKESGVVKTTNFKSKSIRPNNVLSQMLKAARKQYLENKEAEASTGANGRRKSVLAVIQNETARRVSTPRKSSIWVVSANF